jgi:hypothetical protein
MKLRIEMIVVSFLILIAYSCKRNDDNLQKTGTLEQKQKLTNKKFANNVVQFEFEFPDTVYVNKPYNGKIKYKGILDTITTQFNFDSGASKRRYINFIFTKTKNINYNNKHLKTIAHDTIGAFDHNTILLSDIKFTQIGINYIDGIINDNAFIYLNIKDKNGESLARSITDEVRATHKIVVIEKPKSRSAK